VSGAGKGVRQLQDDLTRMVLVITEVVQHHEAHHEIDAVALGSRGREGVEGVFAGEVQSLLETMLGTVSDGGADGRRIDI
jgi:hypothetical protein